MTCQTKRTGLEQAMMVAQRAMLAVRTIHWLHCREVEVQLQGSHDEISGKPYVLIQYAKSYCIKFKNEFGAEIVQRMRVQDREFEMWQFDIRGCLVRWLQEV
ncbi:MAG: hypothetical protein NT086_02065 [Proteobacteria bacterium]|nr:hypothetical protein [Pseudomonadota bacterium]